MKLKKNDIVMLKGNQHKKEMTVMYVDRDQCWCYYRTKKGDFKVMKVEVDSLEKIK